MAQQAPAKSKPTWDRDNENEDEHEDDEIVMHGPSGAGATKAAEDEKPGLLLKKAWPRHDVVKSPRNQGPEDEQALEISPEQDAAAFACT
jgi:hypothetical protein